MEDVLKQVDKIVIWYNENYASATIEQLHNSKSKLITLCYYLAEHLSKLKLDYNSSRFVKKIEFTRKKNELINIGKKIGEAEGLADEHTSEYYEKELSNESVAYRLELLLKQSNLIVRDMEQRISTLKLEYDNSKKQ